MCLAQRLIEFIQSSFMQEAHQILWFQRNESRLKFSLTAISCVIKDRTNKKKRQSNVVVYIRSFVTSNCWTSSWVETIVRNKKKGGRQSGWNGSDSMCFFGDSVSSICDFFGSRKLLGLLLLPSFICSVHCLWKPESLTQLIVNHQFIASYIVPDYSQLPS